MYQGNCDLGIMHAGRGDQRADGDTTVSHIEMQIRGSRWGIGCMGARPWMRWMRTVSSAHRRIAAYAIAMRSLIPLTKSR